MLSKSDKWKIRKGHVQGLSILSAVLTLTTKWLFGTVIRKLVTMQIPILGDYDTKPMFDVIFLESLSFEMTLGLAAASTILLALSYAAITSLALLRSAKTGRKLRSRILQAVVGPHNSRMASEVDSSGYKANELIVKINLIENFMAYDEHGLTTHRATLAMALVLSFIFTWFGGVIAVGMAVCSKFFDHMFDRARSKYRRRIERNTDRANAQFLDVIKNGGKVKIMGMADKEISSLYQVEQESDAYRGIDATLLFFRDLTKFTFVGMVLVLLALVAWRIMDNQDPIDAINTVFAVLLTSLFLDEAHKSIIFLGFIRGRQDSVNNALGVINEFVDFHIGTYPDDTSSSDETNSSDGSGKDLEMAKTTGWKLLLEPSEECSAVSLEKVVLQYAGREKPVLDAYSHSFQRGRIHGLVAESGTGKSSTLKIIAGTLIPDSGSQRVWASRKLAYVSQDETIFARTIRENISYGSESTISDDAAWDALRMASIDQWVASLPNGLDELLEDGEASVSGGQLQRLHMAHLFCTCQQADLVMLDECLSALDQVTREVLIERLAKFLNGKTAIVATHHSDFLQICDEVHDMHPSATGLVHRKKSAPHAECFPYSTSDSAIECVFDYL